MERRLKRGDCEMVYEYFPGKRTVTIVLLHGYGLHRTMWKEQVEYLQCQGYPVVSVDIRGHGDSRPVKEFSVRLAAEDIKAIVDTEHLQQYLLCGLSMGAFVAQEYAYLFGGACGYMLTGVTPLFIPYSKSEKILLAYSGRMMKYLYTWNSLKKAMSKGSTYTKRAYEIVIKMFEEMSKREFLVSWEGFATCLHEESFQFDAPILVVIGEKDTRGTIQSHIPDWRKHYPDCTIKTVADAGHVTNLDQPECFNKMLLSFIRECEPVM